VLLDEPVSALDVSVRAGILALLSSLRVRFDMSYVVVSHDLAMVRHIADRIAVMYLGRIMEIGPVHEVFGAPSHPYTQALLSAIPIPDPREERGRRRIVLHGDPPGPGWRLSGCRFRTRCPRFSELDQSQRRLCHTEDPPERPAGLVDHRSACHYPAHQRIS
jgi:peptide/nickel transport system ATP-binding protein